jgi:hypothetical protein
MASIFPRHNADGSTTWRVMIRRKGKPRAITSFATLQEALEWAEKAERELLFGERKIEIDHLEQRRLNEFGRRK